MKGRMPLKLFFLPAWFLMVVGLWGIGLLSAADLAGTLRFVDTPPQATPVEMLPMTIRSLANGRDVSARVNHEGNFTLRNVDPGPYQLHLAMPARIRSLQFGSQSLSPLHFEIPPHAENPLEVVLSLASTELIARGTGVPPGRNAVAILVPADPMLTQQESCRLNQFSGSETRFPFLPPGQYRLFLVEARFQTEVAKYAPRRPTFLQREAVLVKTRESPSSQVSAHYIEDQAVEEAIREAERSP